MPERKEEFSRKSNNDGRRAFLKSAIAAGSGAAALGVSQVAAADGPGAPMRKHYHVSALPETVHWGFFSKNLKPLATVESGDFVSIETVTHRAGDDVARMVTGDAGVEKIYHWDKAKKTIDRRGAGAMDAKNGAGAAWGSHICTGPIGVVGAASGDVLEVRIVDVRPRPSGNAQHRGKSFGSNAASWWGFQYNDLIEEPKKREVVTIYELDAKGERNWARAVYNYRWTPQTDPFGIVHPTIDYPGLPVDPATITQNHGVLKGIRVPIRPHFGVIAVAPAEADIVTTTPPSHFGGNVDNWRIGKGATMYYPIAVDGALFSVGDPHASQGDSELCGTAIECSLTGTFQLILHKAADTKGTPLENLSYPLLETQDEWVLHGFSFANYLAELGAESQRQIFKKSSLDLAMRDAFRKMRRFLMTTQGLTEDEAISLMSVGVDFGVTQVVDGNWGIHAIIKKNLFAARE